MFEVGKTYHNTHADSLYLCKAVVGEHGWMQNTQSKFDFVSCWEDSWKEYTPPPKMVKREGWINVYHGKDKYGTIGGVLFNSEDEAEELHGEKIATVIHIEWEEEEK